MDDLVAGVRLRLKTTIIGRGIAHFPVVGSTNDEAKKAAMGGKPEGFVVLADRQNYGRGRMGRTWHGADGSLLMSLLLRPPFPPSKMFVLTMLSATAVREAIRRECGLLCDLKWPNDLQFRGKKLGGILTEAGLRGDQIDYAIIGIGLNVNLDVREYAEISDGATSLGPELGRKLDRGNLLCTILEQIEIRYELAKRGDYESIRREWRSALVNLGKQVRVFDREQVLEGVAVDVDDEGNLMLRKEEGTIVRVVTGDVSLRETRGDPGD